VQSDPVQAATKTLSVIDTCQWNEAELIAVPLAHDRSCWAFLYFTFGRASHSLICPVLAVSVPKRGQSSRGS
jgi:hypothetical protein